MREALAPQVLASIPAGKRMFVTPEPIWDVSGEKKRRRKSAPNSAPRYRLDWISNSARGLQTAGKEIDAEIGMARRTKTKSTQIKPSNPGNSKLGRPSGYSKALGTIICERLSQGESLRRICSDKDMPGKSTVMRWLADKELLGFRDQYARARELQADYWAEEIIEIADDGTNDYVERENRDGSTTQAVDLEHINRSRLRVDTRKWLMARLAPKKYGDRVTAEHSGLDGTPIRHHVDIAFIPATTSQD